jgi:hypothetical protein
VSVTEGDADQPVRRQRQVVQVVLRLAWCERVKQVRCGGTVKPNAFFSPWDHTWQAPLG